MTDHDFLLHAELASDSEVPEDAANGPLCPHQGPGEAGVDGTLGTRLVSPARPTHPPEMMEHTFRHCTQLWTRRDESGWAGGGSCQGDLEEGRWPGWGEVGK